MFVKKKNYNWFGDVSINMFIYSLLQSNSSLASSNLSQRSPTNVNDLYNNIMWLAGRIKHNLRAIYNMTSERSNLREKVSQ